MERNYADDIPNTEEVEARDMRYRMEREAIKKYGGNPYEENVIKNGNYRYEAEKIAEIKTAQVKCNEKIKEILSKISSLQDDTAEVVEMQKKIQETLKATDFQAKADENREEAKSEER